MNPKKSGFSTRAIHSGEKHKKQGLSQPQYTRQHHLNSRMQAHAANLMAGVKKDTYIHAVLNPRQKCLRRKWLTLREAKPRWRKTTGMAAISAAVFTSIKGGDHVIADEVIYGSTYDLFVDLKRYGVDVTFIDTSDTNNVEEAFRTDTKLVFFESPANPTMKLTDIKAVSDIAHEKGAAVMIIIHS